jgi:hypothetical protein
MTEEITKVDLNTLSVADLCALYEFVKSTENRPFTAGVDKSAKLVIRNRIVEIENMLMLKVFGVNPFTRQIVTPDMKIEGDVPEKIDLDKFNGNGKTFVVKKNDEDK